MTFLGRPAAIEQISTLSPSQMGLQNQLMGAGLGAGAGGAFGQAADYYRSLLDDTSPTLTAMQAPEMRQFREQIIPGLAEQFAGMGASGTGGGGFSVGGAQAAQGLSERLAAMRAGLRQQGAQGLMGIGQMGLQPYMQNIQRPHQPGLLQQAVGLLGSGLGAIGGPFGLGLGSQLGSSIYDKMLAKRNLPTRSGGLS